LVQEKKWPARNGGKKFNNEGTKGQMEDVPPGGMLIWSDAGEGASKVGKKKLSKKSLKRRKTAGRTPIIYARFQKGI